MVNKLALAPVKAAPTVRIRIPTWRNAPARLNRLLAPNGTTGPLGRRALVLAAVENNTEIAPASRTMPMPRRSKLAKARIARLKNATPWLAQNPNGPIGALGPFAPTDVNLAIGLAPAAPRVLVRLRRRVLATCQRNGATGANGPRARKLAEEANSPVSVLVSTERPDRRVVWDQRRRSALATPKRAQVHPSPNAVETIVYANAA